eukprot:PhM_4_TR757/c0_g1_i1/m.47075
MSSSYYLPDPKESYDVFDEEIDLNNIDISSTTTPPPPSGDNRSSNNCNTMTMVSSPTFCSNSALTAHNQHIPLPLSSPSTIAQSPSTRFSKYAHLGPTELAPGSNVYLPASMERVLKPHQLDAVKFLFTALKVNQRGAVLAHSMGLGKTLTTIATLYSLAQADAVRRVLLLAPKSTLTSWASNEIQGWAARCGLCPFDTELCGDGTGADATVAAISRWRQRSSPCVLVMSPQTFVRVADQCKEADLVIVDEAHKLRTATSQLTRLVDALPTARRVCLTGWPLQNSLMEYVTMLGVAVPGLWARHSELYKKIERLGELCDVTSSRGESVLNAVVSEFHDVALPFVHRRTSECLKEMLPPMHEHVLYLNPTPVQEALLAHVHDTIADNRFQLFRYASVVARIANHPDVLYHDATGRRATASTSSPVPAREEDAAWGDAESTDSSLLSTVDWPRVFTNMGYALGNAGYSSKLVALQRLLKVCEELGEKVLIFSQSIGTLDIIEQYLLPRHRRDVDFVRLDGTSKQSARADAILRLNTDPKVKFAVISTRAGGVGITLTAATRVVMMDVSWNPCNDGQAIHRAYRIGQTRPVHVYRFVLQRTLESRLYYQQRNKMYLFYTIVDRSAKSRRMVTSGERSRVSKRTMLMPTADGCATTSDPSSDDHSVHEFNDWASRLEATGDAVLHAIRRCPEARLCGLTCGHESRDFNVQPSADSTTLLSSSFSSSSSLGLGLHVSTRKRPSSS